MVKANKIGAINDGKALFQCPVCKQAWIDENGDGVTINCSNCDDSIEKSRRDDKILRDKTIYKIRITDLSKLTSDQLLRIYDFVNEVVECSADDRSTSLEVSWTLNDCESIGCHGCPLKNYNNTHCPCPFRKLLSNGFVVCVESVSGE